MKEELQNVLYTYLSSSNTLEKALVKYVNYLLLEANNCNNADDFRTQCKALLNLYSRYISYLDPHDIKRESFERSNNLKPLIQILGVLDAHLQNENPGVPFDSIFRVKSLMSYTEKIWRGSMPSQAEDRLKDLIAFRFTLKNLSPDEFVINCYDFAVQIIPLLEANGFKPIDAEKPKDVCTDRQEFDPNLIYVPSLDEIPELPKTITTKFKDYILYPKKNGYQGLHIIFYSALLDVFLEVQIKTLFMLDHSENYEASHDTYKILVSAENEHVKTENVQTNYTGYANIDYRQFNCLRGFRSRDGKRKNILDSIGLVRPRTYRAYLNS